MIEVRFIEDGSFYLLEYKRKLFFKTKWVLFGKFHGSVGGDIWMVESGKTKEDLLENFLKHKKTRRDCVRIKEYPTIKYI